MARDAAVAGTDGLGYCRSAKPMEALLADLIDAARCAPSVEAYERELFELLDREIGFDVAFCVRGGRPGPISPGFQDAVRRESEGSWQRFAHELVPLCHAARAAGDVNVDVDFFGARRLERLSHYQQLMRPHHGRSSLLGYLRGPSERLIGAVMLGRTTPRFRPSEQRRLQRALPLLALCERALLPAPQVTTASARTAVLTARERDVLSYLQLGYTNPQIALACGTSPRTVRNQLSAIFEKLGASTRAEAVALSLGHG
jgi:DNA-binding CsgD family transcriptional regulator